MSVAYTLVGCSDFEQEQRDDYFIKVGEKVITVGDFDKAFEIAKNAYPHNKIQRPEVIREARLRLIWQLTEEMILLKRAEELGIRLTESQVETELNKIKKDYPDNVFQEILLENAVSYQSWRERLKKRLIMKKVISQELGSGIEITQDEISKYHEEHFKDDSTSSQEKAAPAETKDINDIIEKILRKQKMEKAYASWIKTLRNKYVIKINRKALENMTGG